MSDVFSSSSKKPMIPAGVDIVAKEEKLDRNLADRFLHAHPNRLRIQFRYKYRSYANLDC